MPVQMPDINLIPLLPEIIISLAAMVILLVGAWTGPQERWGLGVLALAGMLLAMGLTFSGGDARVTTFDGLFVGDAFSMFMKGLMFLATIMALVMSWEYRKKHEFDGGEYYVLTLFALLGGLVMASAGDFMVFYLGLELMSLSLYVLAAFKVDDIRSNEAGLKYFVLGGLASGLMLYGVTLVYGSTGTTSFSAIHDALVGMEHVSMGIVVGMIMILSGLAFKIAAVPFHMWAPDVYEGAPTSVTAFMAVVPKIAAFAAIYRIMMDAFLPLQDQWQPMLQVLALLSMAVGAFAAIVQTNIKRMLAYSSVGHMGYALVGFSTAGEAGMKSVIIYLAIYIFMNLGTFALVMALNRDEATGEEIEDFKGLGRKRPVLAFVMMVFMFSMAGIPPLAGFIGKFYVFMAAVDAGFIKLAIAGVLFSAVGAFYYLRIVKLMYFDEAASEFSMPVATTSNAVVWVSWAMILFWGVFPTSLITWAGASIKPFL